MKVAVVTRGVVRLRGQAEERCVACASEIVIDSPRMSLIRWRQFCNSASCADVIDLVFITERIYARLVCEWPLIARASHTNLAVNK